MAPPLAVAVTLVITGEEPFSFLIPYRTPPVVVPLVVSALALGVMELGDVRRLGRVGLRTLGYTLILSLSSVFIGITLVNLLKPGRFEGVIMDR